MNLKKENVNNKVYDQLVADQEPNHATFVRVLPRLLDLGLLGRPVEKMDEQLRLSCCAKHEYLAEFFHMSPVTIAKEILDTWNSITPDQQDHIEMHHERIRDVL